MNPTKTSHGLARHVAVLAAALAVSPAGAQPSEPAADLRLGIADLNPGAGDAAHQIRFDIYKKMGVGILRVDEGGWRDFEPQTGDWRISATQLAYLRLAQKVFAFKSNIGAMDTPAAWFLDAHPDAVMRSETGLTSNNVISYWYPGLHALLEEKDDMIFATLAAQGLLDKVRYLIVPFGPAGEAIYPPNWTTADVNGTPHFWFYDPHAQADFPIRMHAKYGDVAAANRTWGTHYAAWNDVKIPAPGTRPGALWNDVLAWYRDTKRDFIVWQMAHYRRLAEKYWSRESERPRLEILVPGEHVSPYQWHVAVRTGGGDSAVTVMADSEFLLDAAQRFGAVAQYTGLPNIAEVEYLQAYIRARHYAVPLWGENAGNAGAPQELEFEVLGNDLYGQEYIGANIFEADQLTPTPKLSELTREYASLRAIWAGKTSFAIATNVTTIAQNSCLATDLKGEHRLCMQSDGNLMLFARDTPLWSSQTPGARQGLCAADDDPSLRCEAIFQGDGNLVVYRGHTPLWGSNTVQSGKYFALLGQVPYVEITGANGEIVWQPKTAP